MKPPILRNPGRTQKPVTLPALPPATTKDDEALQHVLDATSPRHMPRTYWGLRAMLRAAGFELKRIDELVKSPAEIDRAYDGCRPGPSKGDT